VEVRKGSPDRPVGTVVPGETVGEVELVFGGKYSAAAAPLVPLVVSPAKLAYRARTCRFRREFPGVFTASRDRMEGDALSTVIVGSLLRLNATTSPRSAEHSPSCVQTFRLAEWAHRSAS